MEEAEPITELLTIDETATLLKLSDRTVYAMLREGRLPVAAKVSGKWRVDRDKLLAWIANGGELANGGDLAAVLSELGMAEDQKVKGGSRGQPG